MYMEEKGYIGVLSIKQDHVNVDDIINCSRSLMLFEPQKFFSSQKKYSRLGKNNFWEQIRINLEEKQTFRGSIKSSIYNTFNRGSIDIRYYSTTDIIFVKIIVYTDDYDVLKHLNSIFSDFSRKNIILSASLRTIAEYDWNDSWDIELHRKNHQELKEIRTIKSHHDETIDFEQFSGHTHVIEGLWFGCTYKMWFGKDYDEYIPLQKIADFRDCESNICYENGTRYITMFKSPYDFSDPSCMQKAFKFREVTDCDAAYEHWKKIVTSIDYVQGQVNMEIEKGTFPHGGIRLIRVYLDENNNATLKARAVKVNITERGTDGSVLYEETFDL